MRRAVTLLPYLVYLPNGGTTDLDLSGATGSFTVNWFNPRTGGALAGGPVKSVNGGGKVALGTSPADADEDWLAIIRKQSVGRAKFRPHVRPHFPKPPTSA